MTPDSRNWLVLVLLAGGGWLIYLLAPVITPFAIAAVLAYLGDPLVDRLEKISVWRWKIGRTLAVVLVFVLMLSILTLVLLIVVPMLVEQVRLLIQRFPEWIEWYSSTALPWLADKAGVELENFDPAQFSDMLKAYWKEISTAAFKVIDLVSQGGMAVAAVLTNLVLIPVVTFYLLRDWDLLVGGIHDLLPRNMEGEISRMAGDVDRVLGAFFRGQLMVMLALGLIYTIGLSVVGIELAVLIGMGAGLLSIVPYLGSIVGVLVAAGAAVYQFHDMYHVLMVLLVFGFGQAAEGMYLTPKLVGNQIGLHPVTVIFAVLAGGQLFGFLGILLALPVAAALNVLVRDMHQKYRTSSLYGSAQGGDG
jgi:predicted PurR-regulated permease PerM